MLSQVVKREVGIGGKDSGLLSVVLRVRPLPGVQRIS